MSDGRLIRRRKEFNMLSSLKIFVNVCALLAIRSVQSDPDRGATTLSARLLASNIIKVEWTTEYNTTCNLSDDVDTSIYCIDKTAESVSAVRVAYNSDEYPPTSCDDVRDSCVLDEWDVIEAHGHRVVWNADDRSTLLGYRVCVGVNRTESNALRWSATTIHPHVRIPPVVDKCIIQTSTGGQRVLVDESAAVTVINDDVVRIWCKVSGQPRPAPTPNSGMCIQFKFSISCALITTPDSTQHNSHLNQQLVEKNASKKLSWFHNGMPIESTTDVSNNTGTILFNKARPQHSGSYVLQAVNQYGKVSSSTIHLHLAELPRFPSTELELKYTVKFGDAVRIECRYQYRSHDLSIHWSKGSSVLDQNPSHVVPDDRIVIGLDGSPQRGDIHLTMSEDGFIQQDARMLQSSLMFVNTITDDSGLYLCKVSSAFLDRSYHGSPSNLEIDSSGIPEFHRAPQLMLSSPKSMTTLVGNDHTMQCVFSGKPTPQITWYSSRNPEFAIVASNHFRLSDGNHSLTIVNVSTVDHHGYRCVAVNSEGTNHPTIHLQLTVNEPPKFVTKPSSVNAKVGDDVTFHCSAAGTPQPTITWLINGVSVTDGLSPWKYSLNEPETLVLPNVTLKHNSIVQCNLSNIIGDVIVSSASLVVFLPTVITSGPSDVILSPDSNDIVKFSCEVSSDSATPVSIVWLRGDRRVIFDGQRIYQSHADRSLVINLTSEEDGGRSFVASYTCQASNGLTIDSRPAKLRPPLPSVIRLDDVTLASTGSVVEVLPFGVSFELALIVCAAAALSVVLLFTSFVLLVKWRRHRKQSGDECHFTTLENMASTRSGGLESIEMRLWNRPVDTISSLSGAGFVCENKMVVGLSAIADPALKKALHSMFIPRNSIALGDIIGRGQFGRVHSASLMYDDKQEQQVAVKTMKYKPEEREVIEPFLHEAILMRDFQHLNVLGIIGVSFDPDGSPMVVLPFMANGDLRRYIMNANLDITVLRLLKMALQVSHGMAYLSQKRFVHRDLAARNCMIDAHGVVKVADFGLSRELVMQDYYRLLHNKTPVPVRWMAPESLDMNMFTTMSDVWSFGVLIWELITRGAEPYTDIENWEVANYVKTGKRLPQPLYCPDSVYKIMMRCWLVDPLRRPTFLQVSTDIDFIVTSAIAQPPSCSLQSDSPFFYSNHLDQTAAANSALYRNSDTLVLAECFV